MLLQWIRRRLEARRQARRERERQRRNRAALADFIAQDEAIRRSNSEQHWAQRELEERRAAAGGGPWIPRAGRGERDRWIRVPWSTNRL